MKLGVGQVLSDLSSGNSSDSDKGDRDKRSEKASEDDHGMTAISITIDLL